MSYIFGKFLDTLRKWINAATPFHIHELHNKFSE